MIANPIAEQPAFEFQRVIRGIRAMRQWTQARLGAELGVSAQVIANWEAARSQPNLRDMPMLRAMLNGGEAQMSEYLKAIGEVERSAQSGALTPDQARVLKDTLERALLAIAEQAGKR